MEEEKVQEAQTSEVKKEEVEVEEEKQEKSEKRKKMDFYVELFLFLVLGILVGIAVKGEALKRVTIGYNDYQMKIHKQDYDINKLEADLAKKAEEDAKNAPTDGSAIDSGQAGNEDINANSGSQTNQ